MIGDHVIPASCPSSFLGIEFLGKEKFCIGYAAIALITCDELTVIGLFGISHIADNVSNRCTHRAALPGV